VKLKRLYLLKTFFKTKFAKIYKKIFYLPANLFYLWIQIGAFPYITHLFVSGNGILIGLERYRDSDKDRYGILERRTNNDFDSGISKWYRDFKRHV